MDKNKPDIRFKGFTDNWEQCQLDKLLSLLKDGTHGTHEDVKENGIYLLSAKNIKNGKIIIDETDRKISQEDYKAIHKNFYLQKGDVLLTIVGSIGETAILENPDKITFQRSVAYLRPNEKISSQFLLAAINTNIFQYELKNRQVTSAQSGIYLGQLGIISIQYPKKYEQKKIGVFFKNLDELITLYEYKCNKLKDIKKAMLEKMFPKERFDVPEIHFKGFTNSWKQFILGEAVTISSGYTGDSLLNNGKYHLTRIETISNGFIDESKIGFSNNQPDDSYLLKEGDILYSNINSISHIGKVAIYRENIQLYHGINLLKLKVDAFNYSEFIFYQLNTESKKNWAKTHANQAINQASINQLLLSKQKIAICKLDEQKKIGTFFKHLDSLISLYQQKCKKLKNIKKAMLEKMFV